MNVVYTANNSGGFDWLDIEHWKRLERAGWKVHWLDMEEPIRKFLQTPAYCASKDFPSVEDAVREWTEVTGLDPDSKGCECCGRPHHFRERTA